MNVRAHAWPEELDERAERKFALLFERELRHDDGAAAKAHLRAGRPVYYIDWRFDDEIVRRWPSGQCELVTLDDVGQIIHVRPMPSTQDATS
jgi:hypothetical protein